VHALERRCDCQGVLDLLGSVSDGAESGGDAEAQEIRFESGHAIQAPGSVGQGLDEMGFGRALGTIFFGERFRCRW
jgi:hypothetical protein